MISLIRNYFNRQFSQGDTRTVKAKRNIAALFIMRAFSVFVNFLLVPLTLNYLNPTKYGIWLTLTSLINWVNVLDIGLGTGLRNKFAEAVALNDEELARSYISTAYMFIAIIALAAIAVFLMINPLLDWTRILKTGSEMRSELNSLAIVVFLFFCLRLVFGLIGTILIANQQPAANTFLEILTNILSLLIIFVLTRISSGSLLGVGFVISAISALVPLAANFWYFGKKYRKYSPSIRYVNVRYGRELTNLGVQFFILQVAGILIFSSANVIITQLFGPDQVTPFNLAFKYYGVPSMAFLMILTPFWSAYTDAHIRGDREWIVRSNKKLKKIWLIMVVVVIVMTIASDYVYTFWVGKSIQIPHMLSIFMGIYALIVAWSNIFAYFINGTGKIRLQIWAAILVSIANIFLSLILAKSFGLGSAGVILATCIALLPGCFVWPIQMKKLLQGTATGIWAK